MVHNHDAIYIQIIHALELTTLVLGNLHDSPYKIVWHDNRCLYIRLLNVLYGSRVRQVGRVIHRNHLTVSLVHMVNNAWRRSNQLQIVLPLQTLLNNIHVQKPQEAAAITKAQGNRSLRLKH